MEHKHDTRGGGLGDPERGAENKRAEGLHAADITRCSRHNESEGEESITCKSNERVYGVADTQEQ